MRALCDTLGFEGYQVTGFRLTQRGAAALSEQECDLLLTDLMMPEMDGIALFRAARAVDPDIAGDHHDRSWHHRHGGGGATDRRAGLRAEALPAQVILPVIARALDIRSLRIENAALQRREREQALELAAAYRDLESFSYSISHDLRSPLRAIRGMTQIYLDDAGPTLPESGRDRLNQVIGGAERMDQMIEDLLRFCRLSRGAPERSASISMPSPGVSSAICRWRTPSARSMYASRRCRNAGGSPGFLSRSCPTCSRTPSNSRAIVPTRK